MESWRAFRDTKSRVRYTNETVRNRFVLPLWVTIPFILMMLPILFLQIMFLWYVI